MVRPSGLCKKDLSRHSTKAKEKGKAKEGRITLQRINGPRFEQKAADEHQIWRKTITDVSSRVPMTLLVPVSRFEFANGLSL